MAAVCVLGAGVCGLAGAMLLARDGHDVLVLERDPAPVPASLDEAWECWERSGVGQFRQAHILQARGRAVLDEALPDVRDALLRAGGARLDPLRWMSPAIADRAPRPGDERLSTVTARRPALEHVVATAAQAEPRVEVRRGVGVRRLTARGDDGVPHVDGVLTDDGERVEADLVVDATGRRSALPRWLREAGAAPVHEEGEEGAFVYYTRFFRSPGGRLPQPQGPLLTPLGTFSVVTLPGDNATWSVTVFVAAGDRALKGVRHEDRFDALLRACPRHAHWLDGEPLTGVLAMGGALDRARRLVVDGRPVATGVVALADAWACTNPSLGRGIALGLAHALLLRDVLRDHGGGPAGVAVALDEATERDLAPWYHATAAADRVRLAEVEALRRGETPPAPRTPAERLRAALPAAMGRDPDVFRAGLEIMGCLTHPAEVLARPGLAQRVLAAVGDGPPAPPPGPTREEALRLVA